RCFLALAEREPLALKRDDDGSHFTGRPPLCRLGRQPRAMLPPPAGRARSERGVRRERLDPSERAADSRRAQRRKVEAAARTPLAPDRVTLGSRSPRPLAPNRDNLGSP